MVRQLRAEGITDAVVLQAMSEVPRDRFVASELAEVAHEPRPLPIGEGQTISSPWIVARMIEALGLDGTEHVLEVGTGSGYAAAVLSRCAREVVTIEANAELVHSARQALAGAGCGNVEVLHGDGTDGAPWQAPFDAIMVSAMAPQRIPSALVDQLADAGTLVCPVGRRRQGHLVRLQHGRVEPLVPATFVPLRSPPGR